MGAIGEVLGDHDITVSEQVEVISRSKPGYPNNGDKLRPTLLIEVDAGDTNPTERWSAARRDLKSLLQERGLEDFEVEIQDRNRFYMPSIFPIKPSHSAVARWESVRASIRDIVLERLQTSWQLLSLFMTGRNSSLARPSVVLMVSRLAEHDWKTLAFNLESIMNEGQPDNQKLFIEIMPGISGHCPPGDQQMPGESFVSSLPLHPRMGTSIGVQGEMGGGTLGGYFKLECRGNTHVGLITNSHVVAPPKSARERDRTEYDSWGLDYSARPDNVGRTAVHYFAVKDINATMSEIQQGINLARRDILKSKDEVRRHILERDLATLNQKKTIVEKMPLTLGKTIIASGRGLTPFRRTLDWAFVETHTLGSMNQLPTSDNFIGRKPKDYTDEPNSLALPDKLRGISKIQKGHWYFKIGRTTGITTGVSNGTEAYVMLDVRRHMLDGGGMMKMMAKPGYSEELVIINAKHGLTSQLYQDTFCRSGDSGAIIVDIDGQVAGLLWGEVTGACGPITNERTRERAGGQYVSAGLVTDITDVVRSIEVRTRMGGAAPSQLSVLTESK